MGRVGVHGRAQSHLNVEEAPATADSLIDRTPDTGCCCRIDQGDLAVVAYTVCAYIIAASVGYVREVARQGDPAGGRLPVGNWCTRGGDGAVVVHLAGRQVARRVDQVELIGGGEDEGEGNAAVGGLNRRRRQPPVVSDREDVDEVFRLSGHHQLLAVR